MKEQKNKIKFERRRSNRRYKETERRQNMTIENVTAEDAQDLLAIYAPYVEKTAISFEYEVPSVEEFQMRIHTISARYPYLKAVHNDRIVGYAYAGIFKERSAYDWSVETTVYVDESCKKMGIGRALYQELEKRLKQMGILNMNACIASPVTPSEYLTDDSIRFHHAMGFSEVGTFHASGYKFGEWFDMIWMEKMIGEHKKDTEPVQFGR